MKNKKLWLTLVALIVLVGGSLFFNQFFKGKSGSKTITISIVNEVDNKTLLKEKEYSTDAKNLGDFLAENEKSLTVKMEDSKYGRFLNGLKGLETEDMMKGPWWMYSYSSPSNNVDMKVGQAPGVDQLGLHDGDKVKFVFTTNTGQ